MYPSKEGQGLERKIALGVGGGAGVRRGIISRLRALFEFYSLLVSKPGCSFSLGRLVWSHLQAIVRFIRIVNIRFGSSRTLGEILHCGTYWVGHPQFPHQILSN